MSSFKQRKGNNRHSGLEIASCSSYKYSSVAENNIQTLFTTKVIKSHVKLHVKSDTAKIPRESAPYITLKLHFSQHDREFSACCNTSCGIKLAASQADRLRSACSLAINAPHLLRSMIYRDIKTISFPAGASTMKEGKLFLSVTVLYCHDYLIFFLVEEAFSG